ncbi:hypothetical protein B0J11DRAFT_554222 [Dendryphion nanum]|uniref:Zn(2)-C6 fungal-type domain-containing protein n=1 Tax=Dendryphion nanum TaxID=256645 RepID=A0A9P9IA42_9PLEO|nr:hypothetical protein B0J11DRAFT_554222 [Dendryphion nanum]
MPSNKRPNEDANHYEGPPQSRPARIKACVECKKHKIKCEPVVDQLKCAKCIRSGVDCVPYNLDQKLREEDTTWKARVSTELMQLQTAVRDLLRHNQLPDLNQTPSQHPPVIQNSVISPTNIISENGTIVDCMTVPPMDMTRECSPEHNDDDANDDEPSLVPAPMASLYHLTRIRNLGKSSKKVATCPNLIDEDFIAQGVISLAEAEELFRRYVENNHLYLWAGVLCPYPSLDSIRRSSTLLTSTVLTIAALHTRGRNEALQKCYNIFVSLAYSTCFSRTDSLDDIRALCLAAFFLFNLSWQLSGIAVRNAVEMNIHQSFQKFMRGQAAERDKARLWYVLYVCEHQFSIAYGRPPLIHQDDAINNIERFLESPHTTPGDIRLGAQVALFKILTEAYIRYGSDPEQALTEADFQQLRIFNFAIEQWRLKWQARSADSVHIGSYPSKGVVLYYHFARFQLNSLALRALPPPNAVSSDLLSYDRREAANIAIAAATSTLTFIFDEPDIRRALTAVPIFTHTMVAFCATFLLKMAKTWGRVAQASSPEWTAEPLGLGLNFHIDQVLSLSKRSASLLARVAENVNEKHLTRHIVAGIKDLLKHFEGPTRSVMTVMKALPVPDPHAEDFERGGEDNNMNMGNGNWNMYDLIGSYGFGFDETYLGQAASSDFDLGTWSA